ncbi:hypothetical protein B566_EDAN009012 [Ephemera danica]|nr:hypothetical protein B566_EDAN009012 [Ephemera danica]
MSSVLLNNLETASIGRDEEWPQDAKLFQPYDMEQILLPDNANCLAVQTYLRMCKLPFTVQHRSNAEFMSPSGRVPFLQCGLHLVTELDPIIAFVGNKGISLTDHMDSRQKSDMRADMSLVNNVLISAELYLSWVEPLLLQEVTQPRYGSVFPWPLNNILTYLKRRAVVSKLKALQWANKTPNEVYGEVDKACRNLSARLGNNHFFFSRPTELDALVFGHTYTILSTKLPDNRLADVLRGYPNLISHCDRIQSQFSTRKLSQ